MFSKNTNILDTPITYLKGVGPQKADILGIDLGIHSIKDLLSVYPFRYVDKTKFYTVSEALRQGDAIQVVAELSDIQKIKGKNNKFRLVGHFQDKTGSMELVWFQNTALIEKFLHIGTTYIAFGRISVFNGKASIVHPEMEVFQSQDNAARKALEPVYSSTEKLDSKGCDSKFRRKLIRDIFTKIQVDDISETLPNYIMDKYQLISKYEALRYIHIPNDYNERDQAVRRLKFEEVFYLQLRLLLSRKDRQTKFKSKPFETIGEKFNAFYTHYLPFSLTNAQKKSSKKFAKTWRFPSK